MTSCEDDVDDSEDAEVLGLDVSFVEWVDS